MARRVSYPNGDCPGKSPKAILEAAERGEKGRLKELLQGHPVLYFSKADKDLLLNSIEKKQQWDIVEFMVRRGFAFDQDSLETYTLQALGDNCFPFVAAMAVECRRISSCNVLISILEKFLQHDDLLLEARKIVDLIPQTEEVAWLRQIRSSTAERQTEKEELMQDVLQALDKCIEQPVIPARKE